MVYEKISGSDRRREERVLGDKRRAAFLYCNEVYLIIFQELLKENKLSYLTQTQA